jgi:hypothetical protein
VLKEFERLIEMRRRDMGLRLIEAGAASFDEYKWHVGYSAGMLEALALLKEIVDADADAEE